MGGNYLARTFGAAMTPVSFAGNGMPCGRSSSAFAPCESSVQGDDARKHLGVDLIGTDPGRVVRTLKYPLGRTRYFRNRCGHCQESFDGERCPACGRKLATGSRNHLEQIADRIEPSLPEDPPPWLMVLPLAKVLAELLGVDESSKAVQHRHARLLEALGPERYILTEATQDEIARVGTVQLARILIDQRTRPPGPKPPKPKRGNESRDDGQFSLF